MSSGPSATSSRKQVGMLMGQAKKDPSKLAEAEAVKAQVKADADRLAAAGGAGGEAGARRSTTSCW